MKKKSKPRKKAVQRPKPRKTVKKSVAKKAAPKARKSKSLPKQKATPKPGVIAPINSVRLGYVEDYFAKVGVIALTLEKPVSTGMRIQVLGHTTNFEQVLTSMQIDHQPVALASAKSGVGIKVGSRARKGDHVYLLLA